MARGLSRFCCQPGDMATALLLAATAASAAAPVAVGRDAYTRPSLSSRAGAATAPRETDAPSGAPPDLTATLRASLLSGAVRTSSAAKPVANTVTLEITNTAALPLYRGRTLWTTNAAVATARFIYCNRVNATEQHTCLTCDCCSAATCSNAETAWNIVGSIHVPMFSDWHIRGSGPVDPDPTWYISPTDTNLDILGTGKDRSIAFDFSYVVSFAPPGNTTLELTLRGFPYNETVTYADATFHVPVIKVAGGWRR